MTAVSAPLRRLWSGKQETEEQGPTIYPHCPPTPTTIRQTTTNERESARMTQRRLLHAEGHLLKGFQWSTSPFPLVHPQKVLNVTKTKRQSLRHSWPLESIGGCPQPGVTPIRRSY